MAEPESEAVSAGESVFMITGSGKLAKENNTSRQGLASNLSFCTG